MRLFFATFRLLRRSAERHPEAAQQRARLFVRPRRRADRDLHAAQPVDLVVLDLGEDELLLEPEGVVAAPVEALVRHALEVADTRKRHGHELLEEMPHPLTPERHLEADRHADTQAEVRDGLLRLGHDGTLPGDLREIARGGVHGLRVTDSFAHADVEDDLLDLGDLHDVPVAKLLAQILANVLVVPLLQHRRHLLGLLLNLAASPRRLAHGWSCSLAPAKPCPAHFGSSTTIASPQSLHTRSLVSSSIPWATRAGFPQCGHTTMTLPSPSGI